VRRRPDRVIFRTQQDFIHPYVEDEPGKVSSFLGTSLTCPSLINLETRETTQRCERNNNPTIMDSTIPHDHCKFAVPKKGRLYTQVTDMLRGAGVEYNREPRLDIAICKDLPMTMVFLPASDIPKYVGEGNVDIGVTGIDIVEENGDLEVQRVMDLGFGKCRLCVQAPVAKGIKDVKELAGKRIVTSFPVLTKKFFDPLDQELGVTTSIRFVSGSVEAACGLGLADAVVDLVETGTTMKVR
jgi:ATP phosphoribosyltransferase